MHAILVLGPTGIALVGACPLRGARRLRRRAAHRHRRRGLVHPAPPARPLRRRGGGGGGRRGAPAPRAAGRTPEEPPGGVRCPNGSRAPEPAGRMPRGAAAPVRAAASGLATRWPVRAGPQARRLRLARHRRPATRSGRRRPTDAAACSGPATSSRETAAGRAGSVDSPHRRSACGARRRRASGRRAPAFGAHAATARPRPTARPRQAARGQTGRADRRAVLRRLPGAEAAADPPARSAGPPAAGSAARHLRPADRVHADGRRGRGVRPAGGGDRRGGRRNEPDSLIYACHAVKSAPLQRIVYELYRDEVAYRSTSASRTWSVSSAERQPLVLATNVIELNVNAAKVVPLPTAFRHLSRCPPSRRPGRSGPSRVPAGGASGGERRRAGGPRPPARSRAARRRSG